MPVGPRHTIGESGATCECGKPIQGRRKRCEDCREAHDNAMEIAKRDAKREARRVQRSST